MVKAQEPILKVDEDARAQLRQLIRQARFGAVAVFGSRHSSPPCQPAPALLLAMNGAPTIPDV